VSHFTTNPACTLQEAQSGLTPLLVNGTNVECAQCGSATFEYALLPAVRLGILRQRARRLRALSSSNKRCHSGGADQRFLRTVRCRELLACAGRLQLPAAPCRLHVQHRNVCVSCEHSVLQPGVCLRQLRRPRLAPTCCSQLDWSLSTRHSRRR
jgi:hypothetical protein